MPGRRTELTGWGRTAPSAATVVRPAWADEVATLGWADRPRGVVARGLGRSYGDAAQNAGGTVVDATGLAAFRLHPPGPGDRPARAAGSGLGEGTGTVSAEAGASIESLLRVLVPRGHFVPVTPGTRHVTVGGAVAADIHGKNHHVDGSWCDHVRSLTLALPGGDVVEVGPDGPDAELFWATAGGMGLTGIVLAATFDCPRIETSRLLVDTERAADLDDLMARMEAGDHLHHYSVAWIDLLATGRSLGRSVLTRGRFARLDELGPVERGDPLAYDPKVVAAAPPWVPTGLLNRLSVRAFNEAWFRKAPALRTGELQDIGTFFHPLDLVAGWNRVYGRSGFLQWQVALPFGAEEVLRSVVGQLSAQGFPSFLAVLKRFGAANPGPLSFPVPGWTLALDVPVGPAAMADVLDALDAQVAEAGGRVYLAKDSRLRPELVGAMYPRLGEWREVRRRVDPDGLLTSDLSRRLGL